MIGACLLREHSSLKAFGFILRHWKSVVAKRREIMSRRKVQDDDLASWFSFHPVSRPAPRPGATASVRVRSART